MPFLLDGQLVVIKDDQNEGAYSRIEGTAPQRINLAGASEKIYLL